MTDWPAISSGRKIRPSHITGLQDAVDGIQTGVLPIALPGIAEALGEYADPVSETPLGNMRRARLNIKDFLPSAGDGVTDCTDAINEASAEALSILGGTDMSLAGMPMIEFPPGKYVITDEVEKNSAEWVGAGPRHMTRLVWQGGNGGTMVTQAAGGPAALSFGGIKNMSITTDDPDNHRPETHLDLTAGLIDVLYGLDKLYLSNCSGDSIKLANWVNLHWHHLRWDAVGGYNIACAPSADQFASSFVLDMFTSDHGHASYDGYGFLKIDNSAGSPNTGPICLSNGRVEVNQAWQAPSALVHLVHDDPVFGPSLMPISLNNVAYYNDVSVAPVVVYRDAADTTYGEQITLLNCVLSPDVEITGGTWPSTWYARLATPESGRIPFWSTGEIFQVGAVLDLPGTYDVPLKLGDYRIWVNSGDGKLYIKSSQPNNATDGTVVGSQTA